MSPQQVLCRARSVLADTRCQSTGCYADTGHQATCVRGRAEKVIELIDEQLRGSTPAVTEEQLWRAYGVEP